MMMPECTIKDVGGLRLVCLRAAAALIALTTVAAVSTAPATAADPKPLGAFKDWSAFTFDEAGKKVCYASSQPRETQPKNVRRGLIYTLITHRPAENALSVVSVVLGYPLRKGSDVTVDIDGKKFSLFTDGETGWARDAATDKAIVSALRSGSRMSVSGVSARGTKTRDTYSLAGSTDALNSIGETCGVKD